MAIKVVTVKVKVVSTDPDVQIDYDAAMTAALNDAIEETEKIRFVQRRDAQSGVECYSVWVQDDV